jgi:hypothetical protein
LRRFVPHLHTFSTLRSAGLLHPQYRFIPFHSAGCVPLHSSRIMSVALYFFSGCSFAQPSGLAPLALCLKLRNAYRLTYIFSPPLHARSTSLHSVNYASFPSCGGCSIAATPPLRSSKNNNFGYRCNHYFLRCLGVFIADSIRTFPKGTKQQHQSSKKK